MIQITRDKTKLTARISVNREDWRVWFTYNSETELSAILLQEHLQTEMRNLAEGIREQAYNDGWDDKLKKRNKKTNFWTSLRKTNDSGY